MDNHQIVMKRRLAEKRVSLSIEELQLKREEEKKYALTRTEQKRQAELSTVFSDACPSMRIRKAIEEDQKVKEIRKDYLDASKVKHEKEQAKIQAESNMTGMLLAAAGLPIAVIGLILMETFLLPGLIVCVTGGCITVPSLFAGAIKKRKTRAELRTANTEYEEKEYQMHRAMAKVDEVCKEFHIPVNDPDRSKHLVPLCKAAEEFESLAQKQMDYELFLRINGSDKLKASIVDDIRTLTGKTVTDEKVFAGVLEIFANKHNPALLEDKSNPDNTGAGEENRFRIVDHKEGGAATRAAV